VFRARTILPACLLAASLLLAAPAGAAVPAPVRVTVGDAQITESNTSPRVMTFTVRLSRAVRHPVRVDFATRDRSARARREYGARKGYVVFRPRQRVRRFDVRVYGDFTDEEDKDFEVRLGRPVLLLPTRADRAAAPRLSLRDGVGRGLIVDDDPIPYVSVGDARVVESTGLTPSAVFELSLTAASEKPIYVRAVTGGGTAAGSRDYVHLDQDVLIPPGQRTRQVAIQVNGDKIDEADETLELSVFSPRNAFLHDWQGVAIIQDDDAPPSVSIGDVSVSEGDSGLSEAWFEVALSAPSGLPVSVSYSTTDGSARAGSDYLHATGTLDFAPGETTKWVRVYVAGDTSDESSETFFVGLTTPFSASLGDAQGRGTVVDDDP
jgi:hypothetical protein